mmetsp:Transcript_27432/g.69794  ORF Transcript_27432/g.69794 Transcript_27432/m.69794 type:complete len:271 (-) Transcript_27432:745-1557(-)
MQLDTIGLQWTDTHCASRHGKRMASTRRSSSLATGLGAPPRVWSSLQPSITPKRPPSVRSVHPLTSSRRRCLQCNAMAESEASVMSHALRSNRRRQAPHAFDTSSRTTSSEMRKLAKSLSVWSCKQPVPIASMARGVQACEHALRSSVCSRGNAVATARTAISVIAAQSNKKSVRSRVHDRTTARTHVSLMLVEDRSRPSIAPQCSRAAQRAASLRKLQPKRCRKRSLGNTSDDRAARPASVILVQHDRCSVSSAWQWVAIEVAATSVSL